VVVLHGIKILDVNHHATLHVHVSTSAGKLELAGTNSPFHSMTLTGSPASVSKAFNGMTLLLGHAGRTAVITITATDGTNSDHQSIFANA
jgi:hypothetical protein